MARTRALDLIHEYEKYQKHHRKAFTHINPDHLSHQLKARVHDPDVIAQQGSSWCGPAAFLRSFARDDPAAYAHLIVDLVLFGRAVFRGGPHSAVALHPHPDIMTYSFSRTKIQDADWVGLATLRDQLRQKNTTVGKLFQEGTYPSDIMRYYKEFGYSDVSDWTSQRSLGAESAHSANHFLKHHYRVTLSIHDNMLIPEMMRKNGGRHNHWVDLIGPFEWHGPSDPHHPKTPISLKVFSWGKEYHRHGITAHECYQNYYGFVCAKY